MRYKALISMVLLNLLPAAYAINKSVPHAALPSAQLAADSITAADPYQYCFNNSTWIVPPQTLLAYLYNSGVATPATDQTVWVFDRYDKGYFTGQSYSEIDGTTLSQKFLIGTVTSEGRVGITFYSGTSTSTDLVNGTGVLNVKSSGQCTFVMQMNSGQNGVSGLAHWSYMIAVNPGDYFYDHLPGTGGLTVPQFLAQF